MIRRPHQKDDFLSNLNSEVFLSGVQIFNGLAALRDE